MGKWRYKIIGRDNFKDMKFTCTDFNLEVSYLVIQNIRDKNLSWRQKNDTFTVELYHKK